MQHPITFCFSHHNNNHNHYHYRNTTTAMTTATNVARQVTAATLDEAGFAASNLETSQIRSEPIWRAYLFIIYLFNQLFIYIFKSL